MFGVALQKLFVGVFDTADTTATAGTSLFLKNATNETVMIKFKLCNFYMFVHKHS